MDMKNEDLPKPILTAYAFTEWTWDTPKHPNGTDLWVQDTHPNKFEIWYSTHNWDKVFECDFEIKKCEGVGNWP